MSEYLFLFRFDRGVPSPAEMQARMQKWMSWVDGIAKKGQLKGGQPLESSGRVMTGPKQVITDGPYAEAKDIVGGYLMVTAKDLDGATELARGCPVLEAGGSVEIRAIGQM
jgi:hypothetical protein